MLPDGVFRVGGVIAAPRRRTWVKPEYTQAAYDAGIEGKVELYATIGADGVPRDLRVISSRHPDLDESYGVRKRMAVLPWPKKPG
jgi:TonB family protein